MRTDSHFIYDLSARCRVGIGEACDRAGISRSTPTRWKRGTQPRRSAVGMLQRAILDLARERGTLPSELQHESAEVEPAVEDLLGSVRTIIVEARKLEAALLARGAGSA